MAFDPKPLPVAGVVAVTALGEKQIRQESFIRLQIVDAMGIAVLRDVDAPAIEGQDVELMLGPVPDFTRSVEHDDPRAVLGLDQHAIFRRQGDRAFEVAFVLDHDAVELVGGIVRFHINGEGVRYGGEAALLKQIARELVADLKLQRLELVLRDRTQVEGDREHGRHGKAAEDQCGSNEFPLGGTACPHHHEFAVGDKFAVGELNADETRDGKGQLEQLRQGQDGQMGECTQAVASIDHSLDQSQRSRQPERHRQTKGHEEREAEALKKDIAGESVHCSVSLGRHYSLRQTGTPYFYR